MNENILKGIQQVVAEKLVHNFDISQPQIEEITNLTKQTFPNSLKSFVLKNGTTEIENVLLGKQKPEDGKLLNFCSENLHNIFSKTLGSNVDVNSIANFTVTESLNQFTNQFQESNHSKDLDGICSFLGVDKNILKLANSPVSKFMGKFF